LCVPTASTQKYGVKDVINNIIIKNLKMENGFGFEFGLGA